jgi:hypothetical protein
MVISLSADLATALNDQARKQGVTPEALAVNVLREHLLAAQIQHTNRAGKPHKVRGAERR